VDVGRGVIHRAATYLIIALYSKDWLFRREFLVHARGPGNGRCLYTDLQKLTHAGRAVFTQIYTRPTHRYAPAA
jgi:hypothetical protein